MSVSTPGHRAVVIRALRSAAQPHKHLGFWYCFLTRATKILSGSGAVSVQKCGGQKTKTILTHGGRQRRVKDGGRSAALKGAGARTPEGVEAKNEKIEEVH